MGIRRGRWFVAGALLLAVVAWGLHAAAEVGAAADDAGALRGRLERTLDLDAPLDLLEDEARGELEEIEHELTLVAARLDQPSLTPLRWLPVTSRQLAAAEHQLSAAITTLDIVGSLADVADAVEADLTDPGRRVAALDRLAAATADAATRLRAVELGPDEALVGPLAQGRVELAGHLSEAADLLEEGTRTIEAAATLADGPSRYLVLAANNAQMQNGSGMFLSAGRLDLVDGRVELGAMTSLTDLPLPSDPVELPSHLADRWGWLDPNRDWRHLGLSPRFPETAELAAEMWEAATGEHIDGVIAVDVFVLAELLGVSGPVEVDGLVFDSETAVELLTNGQYLHFFGDGRFDRDAQADRRELLSQVADAVLTELLTELDVEVLRALRDAGAGRHLTIWSADAELQRTWGELGLTGELTPDSMLLSIINRSGNKLDWFLRSHATVEIVEGTETDEVIVTVRVRNTAPEDGQPRYVVGPYHGSGLDAGEYLGVVALTLPADATDGRVDGVESLAVVGSEGPSNRVVGAWIELDRGTSTELTFRFDVPADRSTMTIEPSARTHPTRWTTPDGTNLRDRRAQSLDW
ncbi:MAG: DUF4012 domain-containing protein [Actinomycetota bacterium]